MRYRAEDFQKDFWVNIGKRIRLRREQFGLTRDQLSYEIGVSEKTLGQIERGEHGCSVARLFMIASKLNISVDRLLKGTPQETLPYCSKAVPKSSLTASIMFCYLSCHIYLWMKKGACSYAYRCLRR